MDFFFFFATAITITFFRRKKHSRYAACKPRSIPVDFAATPRCHIFFHLYKIRNHSSLEMRQTTISPSLAFFLLLVIHFKLIQTDFPPSSVSHSSFASFPQRFHPCYLHFFVLSTIHPSLPPSFHLQPSAFSSMQLTPLERASPICQPTFSFQNFCLNFPIKYLKTGTS